MLHESTETTLAPPAAVPDTIPAARTASNTGDTAPSTPADLRALARRAHRDPGAARELAAALLARGWAARRAAALSGLAETAVAALARVRHPATAADSVADDVAARARRRTDGLDAESPHRT